MRFSPKFITRSRKALENLYSPTLSARAHGPGVSCGVWFLCYRASQIEFPLPLPLARRPTRGDCILSRPQGCSKDVGVSSDTMCPATLTLQTALDTLDT